MADANDIATERLKSNDRSKSDEMPGEFRKEPIAIIGIGCRLPHEIDNVESLWDLLIQGGNTVGEVPADRWNLDRYYHPDAAAAGRVLSRRGGFVKRLKEFDAAFWGISPREAALMDPQQRWLLETAWEAIEDAGHPPEQLRGQRVGVYVGASSHDYGTLQLNSLDEVDVHSNTGATSSILANRLSYLLDLCGPSITVDTACSSALVSIVMAIESIRSGHCVAAIAGGVNSLLLPNAGVGFSKASMLSPSGNCFAFDERADGYVRSEGAALMLLKPLSLAIRNKDPIYAVIRGGAVNQDGNTSSMTVPSATGQAEMLRQAYADAEVDPSEVAYVEAHGTGTQVGDPIETRALGEVFGNGRSKDQPLLIGSIKSNLGHLESASGIAGMLKAALVLQRGQVPANANFKKPNPNIPLEDWKLRIAAQQTALIDEGTRPPVVGVNSFGFGGTNAHVVLEKAPEFNVEAVQLDREDGASRDAQKPLLLSISARDPESLQATAKAYRRVLATIGDQLADFCYSAAARREQHDERLMVLGSNADQLRAGLTKWLGSSDALTESTPTPTQPSGYVRGRLTSDHSRLTGPTMVFTGQGSQWTGMGRALMQAEPLFRAAMEEIDGIFVSLSGWSLIDALNDDDPDRVDETTVAQPAIFAIQVGLVRLWKSWGVTPVGVVGHSVGEVAAAWAAGVYDLPTAVELVYHRSQLQGLTAGRGRMAAIGMNAEEVKRRIASFEGEVAITAINGPDMVTIGGDTDPIERLVASFEKDDVFTRWLKLDYAFHTHQMDAIEDQLKDRLSGLNPSPAEIPLFSTVTGELQDTTLMDSGYWWNNVRQPVQFAGAVANAIDGGARLFLEVGPHPSMRSSIESIASSSTVDSTETTVLYSIARDRDTTESLSMNLARMHVDGLLESPLDWQAINQSTGTFVRQPTHCWNYKLFWAEPPGSTLRLQPVVHPLLQTRIPTAQPTWQTALDPAVLTYLQDHRIWDGILFPASGYAEIGFAVAATMYPNERFVIEDIELESAMFISPETLTYLQVVLDETERRITMYSSSDAVTWQQHGRCRLVADRNGTEIPCEDPQQFQTEEALHTDHETLYANLRDRGYGFGEDFSLIHQMWSTDQWSLAEIAVPEALQSSALQADGTQFHPTLLDACFQASLRLSDESNDRRFYLPSGVGRVRLLRKIATLKLFAIANRWTSDGNEIRCDINVVDINGYRIADVRDFCVTATEPASGQLSGDRSRSGIKEDVYVQVGWRSRRLPGTQMEGACRFPKSDDLIQDMMSVRDDEINKRELEIYQSQITPALQKFMIAAVQTAWRELGWGSRFGWSIGETFSTAELLATHAFAEEHHALVQLQLQYFQRAGWLNACAPKTDLLPDHSGENPSRDPLDQRWAVAGEFQSIDVDAQLADLLVTYPNAAPDIDLLKASMSSLSGILSGEINPLEQLFPGGSDALMRRVYTQSPDLASYRELVAATVQQLVEGLPSDRTLRILEIGGGTGAMTESVINAIERVATQTGASLPVEYLFTDVSPVFVSAAKSRFRSSLDLRFAVLDVEQDFQNQKLPTDGFDLVIAANVLHATRDLRETIGNIRRGLAADGMLLVHEITGQDPALENVFGLLPGWWRFADKELRPTSPLLSRSQWTELLEGCGMSDIGEMTTSVTPEGSELALLIAHRDRSDASVDTFVLPPGSQAVVSDPQDEKSDPTLVLFADRAGSLERLGARLRDEGRDVVVLLHGDEFEQTGDSSFVVTPGSCDELVDVLQVLKTDEAQSWGFVFGWGLPAMASESHHETPMTTESLLESQRIGVHSALALVQAIEKVDITSQTRLFLLSRDLQSITASDSASDLASAALSGFAGVVQNELPMLGLTMIDLPVDDEAQDALFHEMQSDHQERAVTYRHGRRYVSRLRRMSPEHRLPRTFEVADGECSFRLQSRKPGVLSSLSWSETRRRELLAGEVEIRTEAVGINFRDVMKALAMYPGNTADRLWLGDDLAGTVERVGTDVSDLKVGDRVLGVAPWALRSHAVVDQRLVVRCPDGMTMAGASTLPTVFLTTQFALDHVARMRSGESILIHAAAGGVGQAAIQVAHHLGLTVMATAGSPSKRELLRGLGVEHVFDSRTFEFAEQIRDLTDGRGVDAVLNSLAGEFIPKSLSVLAPFGRFLEIGKADVYSNRQLGMASLKNNLSYHVIDLSQWIVQQPDSVAKLLVELMNHFEAGRYQPLTHQVFPAADVVDAFRIMAKGEHTGKNVIQMPVSHDLAQTKSNDPSVSQSSDHHQPFRISPCSEDGQLFRSDGTFLVTGGAAGFGFETAKWLVRQGVRSLALMSRSGPDESTVQEIEALRQTGVRVLDTRADVTCRDSVADVIETIESSEYPLRGIVHAAMVIDDDFATNLSQDRFDQVLHPKMLGAWHLHDLTRSIPLEHFILYSSVSTLMGAGRQSNYNAGNEFLNSLARHRRAAGLPGLSVNWSAIEGAGFVHRNETTAAYLRSSGFPMQGLDDALNALGELIQTDADTVGVGAVDWSSASRMGHLNIDRPYFEDIRREDDDPLGRGGLRRQLAKASPAQRPMVMSQFLIEQVAGVFGIDPSEVDPNVSLSRLGLDSLMAVELVNRIESELDSKVPMSRLLSGPSIHQLTDLILGTIDIADGESPTASTASDWQADISWDPSIEVSDCRPLAPPNGLLDGQPTTRSAGPVSFLTGATGFLGAHLLSDLLLHTDDSIVCLVRASDQHVGRERIQSNLARYGLLEQVQFDRVEIVLGDLEQPRLGLMSSAFNELSHRVDTIYHNGANVNLIQPYESLRRVNVDGTREVLRLACQSKVKPIHFVSTYTVHATEESRGQVVPEDAALPKFDDLLYGYSQTKWVGEGILQEARQRGVPVTIYRPGHITGDSRTGIGNEDDLLHSVVLMCVEIGAAPMHDVEVDATPVDFVSRSIVSLSKQNDSDGEIYHLTNPNPFQTKVLRDWLQGTSFSVELVDPDRWRELLKEYGVASPDNQGAATMLSALLSPVSGKESNQTNALLPRLDSSRTIDRLAALGIFCPPADSQMLIKGAAHLSRLGLVDRMDFPSLSTPIPKSSRSVATT